jgi:hypothetical protein
MLYYFQLDIMLGCRFFSRLSCVALIHVSQLNMLLRDLLYLPGQFADLCAVLLIGRRDVKGEQMAQRVHRCMHLRSLAPLGSIIACSRAGLRRGLQRAAVQNHRRWLCFAPGEFAQ